MVIFTNYATPKVSLEVRGLNRLLSHFINTTLAPDLFWQFYVPSKVNSHLPIFFRETDLCEKARLSKRFRWFKSV
jgi:hypothetical protein